MNPEERERLKILCDQIATERDHERFVKLVQELNDLLEEKDHRLDRFAIKPEPKAPASTMD